MIYKQNLHTHTKFCDGDNTPEEIVKKAIELGYDTIGFSGHSYMGLGVTWDMSKEETTLYNKEVEALKEKYKNEICILRGIEWDIISPWDYADYDYIIASVHFFEQDGEVIAFDASAKEFEENINKYFGGNGMAYAKKYYETVSTLNEKGKFDIVGHFDIISKHCEKQNFFDVNSKEYKDMALEALHTLSEKSKVFEVNTGAIARGYRKTPYPAPFLLKEMKKLGCTVILTADCHNINYLNCHYKESLEYIESCGFESIGVMKNGKITEINIRG